MTFAKISTLLIWLVIWAASVFIRLNHKNDPKPEFVGKSNLTSAALIIYFTFLYTILWISPPTLEKSISVNWVSTWSLIGYFLLFSGTAVVIWAAAILGRLWAVTTSVASNYPFLKSGPYAFVRHPAYLGQILIWIGTTLIFLSPIAFASGLIFFIPIISCRMRAEEKNLLFVYGDDYNDYKNRVNRLFPKIW